MPAIHELATPVLHCWPPVLLFPPPVQGEQVSVKQHVCMEQHAYKKDALHMPPYCLHLHHGLRASACNRAPKELKTQQPKSIALHSQIGLKLDSQLMQACFRDTVLASWLCCGDSKHQS